MNNITPFELERYFNKYEFSIKHLLSCSDCEPLSVSNLLQYADNQSKDLWNNTILSYTESTGNPLLLQEISNLYTHIEPTSILPIIPEEGIYIAMRSLLQKDDEVVCISPCYQSLYEIAKFQGAHIKKWNSIYQDGWHYLISDLKKLVTENTKMIVINFPHNPTGALLLKNEFEEVIQIARKNNCILFSDEMYRFLEYNENDRLPSACEVYEQAISLCGLSKSFAMPGARSGWLITKNSDIMHSLRAYKNYTSICGSATSEILSIIALRQKDRILQRNLDIIANNIYDLLIFKEKYKNMINIDIPIAGSICFPVLHSKYDINIVAQKLITEKNMMVLPAKVYHDASNSFRLGFGRIDFKDNLDIFDDWLQNNL